LRHLVIFPALASFLYSGLAIAMIVTPRAIRVGALVIAAGAIAIAGFLAVATLRASKPPLFIFLAPPSIGVGTYLVGASAVLAVAAALLTTVPKRNLSTGGTGLGL
jgi:hypothetical protein